VCDLGEAADCGDAEALPIVSDAGYDALGRRTTTEMPGGTRSFGYVGATARLVSDQFAASGASYTFQRTYESYDGLGNVLEITGTSAPGDVDLDESYTYDARNRLDSWTQGDQTRGYAYDALGNLTTKAGEPQAFDDPTRPHALQGRADGTTYAYDDVGNVTAITGGGSPARHLTFDSANRLVCVDETTPGGCGQARLFHDVDGQKLLDDEPGSSVSYRVYLDGATWVERMGEYVTRIEIHAFGERVAYKTSNAAPRTAPVLPVAWPRVPPGAFQREEKRAALRAGQPKRGGSGGCAASAAPPRSEKRSEPVLPAVGLAVTVPDGDHLDPFLLDAK